MVQRVVISFLNSYLPKISLFLSKFVTSFSRVYVKEIWIKNFFSFVEGWGGGWVMYIPPLLPLMEVPPLDGGYLHRVLQNFENFTSLVRETSSKKMTIKFEFHLKSCELEKFFLLKLWGGVLLHTLNIIHRFSHNTHSWKNRKGIRNCGSAKTGDLQNQSMIGKQIGWF